MHAAGITEDVPHCGSSYVMDARGEERRLPAQNLSLHTHIQLFSPLDHAALSLLSLSSAHGRNPLI